MILPNLNQFMVFHIHRQKGTLSSVPIADIPLKIIEEISGTEKG